MNRSWWRVLTKHGPLEKRMANHFSILALKTPWTGWKGKKIWHWKMKSQVSRCPICYWRRVENNTRMNEEMEPKQRQCPVVDVTGDGSKVWCCKEQYCIGTWDVRSMNSRFIYNIALYNIGPCFYHQSHPQLGVVFALAPSLHSFWSYFSTLFQQHIGHLPTWGVHLSVSYLFAFSYCSWGSQGKNTEVIYHSLPQWTTFCQNSPP